MKISTRLGINTYVSLALIIIMMFFLAWSFVETDKADRNELITRDMLKIIFERILLRDDYLLHEEERSNVQWVAKTETLRALLASTQERFTDTEEKYLLQEAQKAFEMTRRIFSDLIEYRIREQRQAPSRFAFGEAEVLLISQIFQKAYVLNDNITRLNGLAQRKAIKARNRLVLFIVIFVAFCIATIVINSRAINRLVMKRLATLSKGVRIIGNGHLDHRIYVEGNDELSELGRLNNEMAENLNKSFTSVENLQREVTERKHAEEEIRLLNLTLEQRILDRTIQLEALNKELRAFSYSVSHDLRGPLRGIDGFSQALLEDYGDRLDDTGKNYLERVCKATQHMGWLIDDMLKLARVSQSEFHRETVDLSCMVRTIAEHYQAHNPGRAVDVTVQEGIIFQCDPSLMKIALENLINNAFKFTGKEAHPRIEFGMTVMDGKTAYFIRDNGAGFDMTYVGKLFGTFQRLHTSDEFPGTGIGLATVQRVIHRHGGQIWAKGEPGKGATFYFTVPSVQA